MNRVKTIAFLLLVLSAVSLFAQAKPRLAILPFTGGSPEDAETIAEFFSFQDEINRVFTPVPRTSAIGAWMKEQDFQRSGLTDSDTIADLGKELGADYVLAGHIAVLGGSSKLLLITIINVKELQQIAGDYREYERIESVIGVMPGMAKRIADAAVRDSSDLPRLAVLPFNVLSSGMDLGDAELLAQLLATELVKSGRYAVFPRTTTIERVMEEHHIERSGITDPESIKAIGKAVNVQYVLAASVRKLGDDNYFSAAVLHIENASQEQGVPEQYQTVTDGLTLMPRIAQRLGTGSITVHSAVAGTIMVGDWNTEVIVREGGAAVVPNVNAGTVPVAVRMAGGELAQGSSVTVEAGGTANVRIERPAPPPVVEPVEVEPVVQVDPPPVKTREQEKAEEREERSRARALQNTRVSTGNDFMQAVAGINALSTPGTYRITLTNNIDIDAVTFSSGGVEKTIIIRGGSLCAITNNGTGNLFTLERGNTLVLEKNVKLDGNNRERHVVMVNEGGVLVMTAGSRIERAKTAGVYIGSGGRFTMEDGEISGNTTQFGGGVYVTKGTFIMSGGTIRGNSGGGVYAGEGSTFTMSGGTISGNTAATGGGGAFVFGCRFTMEGGEISGNMTNNNGGGVYAGEGSTFVMSGGTIGRNTASFGGGVYVHKGTFMMSRGTIDGNTVNNNGGGVYTGDSSTFTMSGGTIRKNTATWGGGVNVGDNGRFTMSGGTIDGNTANSYGGGVYLYSGSKFTKSGGAIGGANKAGTGRAGTGNVVFGYGSPNSKWRDRAAGSGVNMDSNVNGAAGGWN
jgi:parallel beta-helix repeat protein